MDFEFTGGGPTKDRARRRVYDACSVYWRNHGRPLGQSVVLCGPYPSDAQELMRLGVPASMCWFVDNKKIDGLKKVSTVMPGAHVFFGDVGVLLKRLEPLAFVNLDLMSHVTTIDDLLVLAMKRTAPGGLIALTFVCGRENPNSAQVRLIEEGQGSTMEEARWSFLKNRLNRTRRPYEELLRIRYRDRKMKMACIVLVVQ